MLKRSFALRACLSPLVAALVAAPLSATTVGYDAVGAIYQQDFDSLPTQTFGSSTQTGKGPHALNTAFGVTGLEGWYGANPGGSSGNTEFKAHDGSLSGSAGRGVISFGTNDSSDRALGALSTSNQVNSFGLVLTNLTGSPLTSVNLSYFGEQWRHGEPTGNLLAFDFGVFATFADADFLSATGTAGFTAVSALDFAALKDGANPQVALDGNLAENRTSIAGSFAVNWNPGEVLVLRWTANDLPGQDSGLAIDNLQFSAIPEPSTYAALFGGAVLLVVAVRRFRARR